MDNTKSKPTKEGFRKFEQNYKGILNADRAYMAFATGDRRYKLRSDIFPGTSVNNLPDK